MNQPAAPSNPPPPAVDPAAAVTPPWVDIYLNELGTHFQASRALLAAGINFHILAEYRHVSESFAAQEARCQSCLGEFLQSEAIRRSTAVPELNANGRRSTLSPAGGDRLLIRLLDFIIPGFRSTLPAAQPRRPAADFTAQQFKDRLLRQEQSLQTVSQQVDEHHEHILNVCDDLQSFHSIVFRRPADPSADPASASHSPSEPLPTAADFTCAPPPENPVFRTRQAIAKLDRRHRSEVLDLNQQITQATHDIDRLRALDAPNLDAKVKLLTQKIQHCEFALREEIADYTEKRRALETQIPAESGPSP